MNAALVIAARSLRQRIRSRSAIMFGVVVPLGLAAAFTLLIPRGSSYHVTYAVYDGDGGPIASGLTHDTFAAVAESGVATFTPVSSEAAAIAALDDGKTAAAIIVPAGFSSAIQTGRATEVRIVALPGTDLPVTIARSIVGQFATRVAADQLAVIATSLGGAHVEPATVDAALSAAPSPIVASDVATDSKEADNPTFYASGMAIMFVFFTTISGPIGLLIERRTGTLARLLAAPVRPASIVLGNSIAAFVLGLISMAVVVAATTVLLGASWGPPVPVILLVLTAVMSATGLSILLCTLARTEDQAGGWNAILAITMAMLGGAMIPLQQAPQLLLQLGRVTPHAWFLAAINTMAAPGTGVADIMPSLVFLAGFGVVTGALGLIRAQSFLVAR